MLDFPRTYCLNPEVKRSALGVDRYPVLGREEFAYFTVLTDSKLTPSPERSHGRACDIV